MRMRASVFVSMKKKTSFLRITKQTTNEESESESEWDSYLNDVFVS